MCRSAAVRPPGWRGVGAKFPVPRFSWMGRALEAVGDVPTPPLRRQTPVRQCRFELRPVPQRDALSLPSDSSFRSVLDRVRDRSAAWTPVPAAVLNPARDPTARCPQDTCFGTPFRTERTTRGVNIDSSIDFRRYSVLHDRKKPIRYKRKN
jgi:hypothetical protein